MQQVHCWYALVAVAERSLPRQTWQSVVFTASLQDHSRKRSTCWKKTCQRWPKDHHHIHHAWNLVFSTSYMYQRIFRQRAVEIMDLKHHQKANWIQQIKNLHFTLFYLYDPICSICFFYFHVWRFLKWPHPQKPTKNDPQNHGLKVQSISFSRAPFFYCQPLVFGSVPPQTIHVCIWHNFPTWKP